MAAASSTASALPEDWRVDKQIIPNMAVGAHVAAVSISSHHSRRLLEPAPLEVGGVLEGPRAGREACAAWIDWAGVVETAAPWVDYFIDQYQPDSDQGPPSIPKALIQTQVRTVADVLKALRSVTNETYFEDGVMVNHGLAEFRDLEK